MPSVRAKFKFLLLTLASATAMASAAYAQTPILDYTFDGNGTNTGSAGSSGNLTLQGTATYSSPGLDGGSALSDDGSKNNYAGGGSSVFSGGGTLDSFTITAWVNEAAVQTNDYSPIFTDGTSAIGDSNFSLTIQNGNKLGATVNGNPDHELTSNTSSLLSTANEWVFVAFTYNGTVSSGNTQFYVGTTSSTAAAIGALLPNGNAGNTSAGSYTYSGGQTAVYEFNGNPLEVGGNQGNASLNGLVDDVEVFASTTDSSGALSLAQIDAVQAAGVPEPQVLGLMVGGLGLLAFVLNRRRLAFRQS